MTTSAGTPSKFWNWTTQHWVVFRLFTGDYQNFLVFLEYHNLQFILEMEIDFTNIPSVLHGKGQSKNLGEYISNNNENSTVIQNFLNYFITSILDLRYISGKKLVFQLLPSTNWQNMKIEIQGAHVTTSTTTEYVTTTLMPTTTFPLGFTELFGQLYMI